MMGSFLEEPPTVVQAGSLTRRVSFWGWSLGLTGMEETDEPQWLAA